MDIDVSYMEELEFFLCQGAAKKDEISTAEKQLGVRFSEDYRAYLLNYGEVSFGSHELTGICRSERINVVNVTEEAKKLYGNFPSDCYVIEDTYFDDIYILQNTNGEVFEISPEKTITKIADDLKGYIDLSNEE